MTASHATLAVSGVRTDAAVPKRATLRPAPRREPPFDDELGRRHLSLVGTLDQPLPFDTAASSASDVQPIDLERMGLHGAQAPSGVTDPTMIARRLVIAIIETATGRRSPSQLMLHTAPAVLAGLTRDASRISRLGTAGRPAKLHSLHCRVPADGVAEVAAVIRLDERFRAMAMRLELQSDRWRCVRLQIG